jgi:uncharacterized membrane protein YjjP (DUF1212 family)
MMLVDHPSNMEITESEQRDRTRLCARAAQLLMQHGAESALVETVCVRMGKAVGLDDVQLAVTSNALLLTTFCGEHCITTVRRVVDHGINMHVVIEVQRAMLLAEVREIGIGEIWQRLEAVRPLHYPKALVALMIGLSCACFGGLMGADIASCLLVFAASAVAMAARQSLALWHFNPFVNFAATAFVATSIACWGVHRGVGHSPDAAMAASVLLLIPGFPLINAVSDMVKGYVAMGVARWTFAMLLIMASSMGVLLALSIWNGRVWI